MSNSYIVQPVAKALQVLEYVVEEGRELTLTEIAYKVQLPKTTVFRYLQTLRQAGFVAYDTKSDRYRTGLRIWALGQSVGSRSVMYEIALPTMRSLRDCFNETINLGELDGREVVYLEMVESRRSLRMQARLGSRDPVYSTAIGKAILAFLPAECLADHLPAEFVTRTPRTISSLEALQRELAQTRERGYALDRGENEEGACCIGAPLFNPGGQVSAAISLSAPDTRMTHSLEQEIARALLEATADISKRLGFRSKSL